MNRSVLLVICDFLILTLLTFVQFDTGPAPTMAVPTEPGVAAASASVSNVVAVLEDALELERQQRMALTNALAAKAAELDERRRLLVEREAALSGARERLEATEAEAKRLADERARLELARTEAVTSVRVLKEAFETTRQSADTLQDRLTDTVREATEAKTRLQIMEEEMSRRRAEAESMQQRIGELAATQDRLKEEKYQLVADLRQTEVEAKVARREVTNLAQQLTVVGEEKARLIQTAAVLATNVTSLTTNVTTLATDVTTLAAQSTAMREQIDRQVRLAANTIFADFQTNRVTTDMTGTTRGGLGQEVVRRRQGATVLVRIDGRVYAVLHLETTPLRLWPPDAPWKAFQVLLARGANRVASEGFSLVRRDPRVALLPVDDTQVARLGARVYEPATDAAQFSDAVVIGGEEGYYGESAFRLNGEHAGYVSMERSTFRRLLGDFAPRRGDLAFTKTGQLLGIMVNGEHCLLLDRLETLPPFRTGETLDTSGNTAIVGMAQAILERQPAALR